MINLRRAVQTDVDWVFACCEDFARFYGSKISLAGNPEYGKNFLSSIVAAHYMLIAEIEGERAGFIAGLVSPHHFNPDITQLTELLWWVPEKFRSAGVGSALFKEFNAFGELNCDWVTFTLEHNSPIDDRFLIASGFVMTEKAYLKECK